MRATIGLAVALLVALGACADDPEVQVASGNSTTNTTASGTASGVQPTEFDGSRLTVEDSCGTSFTVRNAMGTMRLTISPSPDEREASDPGTFELGENGWTGELEVGAFLDVWPCHDVGSDFEREQIVEVWTVVGGSVELIDPIPAETDGGGGVGEVRAHVVEVTLESPTGATAEMTNIDLVNPSWGFYGG